MIGFRALVIPILLAFGLSGCAWKETSTLPQQQKPPVAQGQSAARQPASSRPTPPKSNIGRYTLADDEAPLYHEIPPYVLDIPDAVPVAEPRSRGGNSPEYEVYGATYRVMASAEGYRERGGASWYGRKFHGHLTANGEIYDMFAMTAAHKTLPIPSYVRVTHLGNQRSVVVRINDRGPFHEGRIIDLSYAAAARLDMLTAGSAEVLVEALIPDHTQVAQTAAPRPDARAAAVATASMSAAPPAVNTVGTPNGYWQAGAFLMASNAGALYDRLRSAALNHVSIHESSRDDGKRFYRVVVGPYASQDEGEQTRQRLLATGLNPRWVVAR